MISGPFNDATNSQTPDVPGSNGEDFGPGNGNGTPARHTMLREFLPGLLDDVLRGEPPPEYQFTTEKWGTLALTPKQITCIGGGPNCGKTSLASRISTGALLMNPELRAVYACVEMDERILMERTLARLSGVYLTKILKRQRDAFFEERIEAARPQMESLADQLMFIQRPFTMLDVRAACEEFQPHIVVLDYLQRIPADTRLLETRQQIMQTMTQVRLLADQGPAVLLVAALNRQAGSRAQTRASASDDNVNDLAVFRDSSDIEYSVDDAFVLVKDEGNVVAQSEDEYEPKKLVLRHVKARNSLMIHVPLQFDGRLQEFKLRPWPSHEDKTFTGPFPTIDVAGPKKLKDFAGDTFLGLLDDHGSTTWLS